MSSEPSTKKAKTEHLTKTTFYEKLLKDAKNVVGSTKDYMSNCANIASLVYHSFHESYGDASVNWVGFYLVRPVALSDKVTSDSSDSKEHADVINDRVLSLGPFHGKPAVTLIPYAKGVCGTAAVERTTQLVPNVHLHPNHIACDSASNSELVIPIFSGNSKGDSAVELLGVFDLDSPVVDFFSEEDATSLGAVVSLLVSGSSWPSLSQSSVVLSLPSAFFTASPTCSIKKKGHTPLVGH